MRAAAIEDAHDALAKARELKAGASQTLFNVSLYILLLDQDLSEFTDDMVYAFDRRRRRFVAKHEAVLLYEAAEDLPQLLGKDLRDAVKDLGASSDQIKKLNDAAKALHQFWEAHRDFLGSIRQALAAHRDHDSLLYMERLEALEPLAVMRLAADFSKCLGSLVAVLIELTLLSTNVETLMKDVVRTSQKSAG